MSEKPLLYPTVRDEVFQSKLCAYVVPFNLFMCAVNQLYQVGLWNRTPCLGGISALCARWTLRSAGFDRRACV
jgi:hypothetical protein